MIFLNILDFIIKELLYLHASMVIAVVSTSTVLKASGGGNCRLGTAVDSRRLDPVIILAYMLASKCFRRFSSHHYSLFHKDFSTLVSIHFLQHGKCVCCCHFLNYRTLVCSNVLEVAFL